jgi:ubiquinone/menaquinone biosynthesis C-methylase UbiE
MAFEELKQRQGVMWGSAPFEEIARQIAVMHNDLVARLDPQPGQRWLDLGTGTGEVAFRAARAGAQVTASDLSPELIDTAKRQAAEQGLEIDFAVVDAEKTPYEDASFDVVSSSVGVIFAPDHRAIAGELARVTRPGGRIGLTAWRAEAGVGAMFVAMKPFQPPPPEGAGSPFQWGDESYVERLLGDAFELEFHEGDSPQTGDSGEQIWNDYVSWYGPSRTLHDSLGPERQAELNRTMAEFFERFRGEDGIHQSRPYIVILGTRR